MPRLMSVSLTEQAVVERRKTVTRRLGWWEDRNGRRLLKPGDRLTLCRKVRGRCTCPECGGDPECPECGDRNDRGPIDDLTRWCDWCEGAPCPTCLGTGREPLVRLAEVEVVAVDREQLNLGARRHGPGESSREGFDHLTWSEFVDFFAREMRCRRSAQVTRIEWRYLDEAGS